MGTEGSIVVADTSLVVNFLRLDRMDLLGAFRPDVMTTNHVGGEITDPDQRLRYERAQAAGYVREEAVTDPVEVLDFLRLSRASRLGAGECSAIAVALNRSYPLAVDDNKALKRALSEAGIGHRKLIVLRTPDIIVELIRAGKLDIATADAMKKAWALHHRFKLKIQSFAELA